jgi:hypothetical protein
MQRTLNIYICLYWLSLSLSLPPPVFSSIYIYINTRYEWDLLGYDVNTDEYYGPCPDDIVNCGFDTNYPNYSGVRTNFSSSLKAIQELGVYVFPYINGRIFDQSVESWNPAGRIASS